MDFKNFNRRLTSSAVMLVMLAGFSSPSYAYETLRNRSTVIKARIQGFFPNSHTKWTQNTTSNPTLGRMKMANTIGGEIGSSFFFTDSLAAEVTVGYTPYRVKHNAAYTGELLAETNFRHAHSKLSLVPITGILQFHTPELGPTSPYVGVGYHYTFINTRKSDAKFSNTHGAVIQAGVNITSSERVGFNIDMKYYWMTSKMKYNYNNTSLKAKQRINPFVLSAGITYRL